MGILAWAYQAIQPLPPKTCGSPDGPPVTASRIKLKDGRYLAYKEHGVPRDAAKYKMVFIHGFDCCRHDAIVADALSPVLICLFIFLYYFEWSSELSAITCSSKFHFTSLIVVSTRKLLKL